MDLATQLVTVAAVVLGALMTYATNFISERAQHRRRLVFRWDERKLDAYAAYVAGVRSCVYAAVLLYEARVGLRNTAQPESDLEIALTDAERQRALAFERLMLLASEDVIDAAHAVNKVTAEIDWAARSGPATELEAWRALHRSVFAEINRFHQESRRDLFVMGAFDGEQHARRDLILPETRQPRSGEPAEGNSNG